MAVCRLATLQHQRPLEEAQCQTGRCSQVNILPLGNLHQPSFRKPQTSGPGPPHQNLEMHACSRKIVQVVSLGGCFAAKYQSHVVCHCNKGFKPTKRQH
eukprot:6461865-Amphidinium_carterae.1